MSDPSHILLKKLQAHKSDMRRVVASLESISWTLEEVDMSRMAEKIGHLAMTIAESTAELDRAYSDDLDNRFKDAQRHVGLTLMALLNPVTEEE